MSELQTPTLPPDYEFEAVTEMSATPGNVEWVVKVWFRELVYTLERKPFRPAKSLDDHRTCVETRALKREKGTMVDYTLGWDRFKNVGDGSNALASVNEAYNAWLAKLVLEK